MNKLFITLALLSLPVSVMAAPRKKAKPMGKSAIVAAKLQKGSAVPWLNHYLPADRYKIAGKIWVVVSTETSKRFYNPSSFTMMQADPNRVIGFASEKDAKEAGYLPGFDYVAPRKDEEILDSKLGFLDFAFSAPSAAAGAPGTSGAPGAAPGAVPGAAPAAIPGSEQGSTEGRS